MLLTFKHKLKLNDDQIDILNKISEDARLLYNYLLNNVVEHYKLTQKYINYYDQQKLLKDLHFDYLTYDIKKEVLRNLNDNYKSFFTLIKKNKDKNPKTPKFKGYKYFCTLSYIQDFIIKDNQIIISLPNRERLKIDLTYSVPIDGLICKRNKTKDSQIKQLKIYRKNNEYFVSIVYEKTIQLNETDNLIAIDLGKKNLVTYYDKQTNRAVIYNSSNLSKNQKYYDNRIDELKSKRDLKKRQSIKSKQLNQKIQKLYAKKSQQSTLTLHKLSKDISNLNSNIIIGDLTNLKQNTKTKFKKLNRQMQNNWSLMTFISLLSYKVELRGNQLIKINEAWTSKTCSHCGNIMNNQTLSDRQYKCDCGLDIDRDVNASINIMNKYLGDYNTPIEVNYETLITSERFSWCHTKKMNII